ncbi:unnamed protein product [Nyctereutes procyonoides]|uniref:(raccoon dog) hypothetical protein n=1 Tax=Nyctereutes procyonoides TaxID=34880 RepID=A0A811Y6M5_NYCPR|nr:unnamed protein product [Nyctereutes procyonoides]
MYHSLTHPPQIRLMYFKPAEPLRYYRGNAHPKQGVWPCQIPSWERQSSAQHQVVGASKCVCEHLCFISIYSGHPLARCVLRTGDHFSGSDVCHFWAGALIGDERPSRNSFSNRTTELPWWVVSSLGPASPHGLPTSQMVHPTTTNETAGPRPCGGHARSFLGPVARGRSPGWAAAHGPAQDGCWL